jgi:hypothetical protein
VDTAPELPSKTLSEAPEERPRLLLFLVKAKEILARVRKSARNSEKRVRTLLRDDAPAPPQPPHLPNGFQENEAAEDFEDEKGQCETP